MLLIKQVFLFCFLLKLIFIFIIIILENYGDILSLMIMLTKDIALVNPSTVMTIICRTMLLLFLFSYAISTLRTKALIFI